jgi:methylated-DNA-[protein]-cysteine S-methyltransferase
MKPVAIDYLSPIGYWQITASEQALIALRWIRENDGREKTATTPPTGTHPLLDEVCRQLTEYFAGKRKTFNLPLAPAGTDFQKQVWNQLRQIPYGQTLGYAQLARQINHPKAWRAVGSANGKNPLAILIPCHRIVRSNGDLGGYAYGQHIKKQLLDLELRS